jgi:DNA polymerase III subunit gamma/tau
MSWHTKYRPKKVADLHLVAVRQVLQKMMDKGQFPQVFLCAGPKGTGKTSTSRIIGAMLNDEQNAPAVQSLYFDKQAGKNTALVDPDPKANLADAIFTGHSFVVQEMDAASNRGIDDVRQLKERVSLPPQEGVMSVYILDEVHMLTTEAFNALLKLLEEPPAHAVFILATTELHKVPQTVRSRCTVLPFHKASSDEIKQALEKVVSAEKVKIDDQALEIITDQADGSFRDAIKLLEIISATSDQKIGVKEVHAVLQTGFLEQVPELLQAVVDKNEKKVAEKISAFRNTGVASGALHKALLTFLHHDLMAAIGIVEEEAHFSEKVSHFLLSELEQLQPTAVEVIPLLSLELKLLDVVFRAQARSGSGGSGKKKKQPQQPEKTKSQSGKVATSQTGDLNDIDQEQFETSFETQVESSDDTLSVSLNENNVLPPALEDLSSDNLATPTDVDTKPLLEGWAKFVGLVEQQNSTVAALLRSAKPLLEESNGVAKIEVYYSFHRDQLMQPKFLTMLQKCAESIIGQAPAFEFILNKKPDLTKEVIVSVPDSVAVNDVPPPAGDLATLAGQALM